LAQAMEVVNPVRVYIVGVEPATTELQAFLERLMGMIKHDLRVRGGQVDVRRLAAALGHREVTVQAGLEWLVARGQLRIVETSRDALMLQAGGVAQPSPASAHLGSRLRHLLAETAAYRRHFRSAPIEMLGVSD
jgi:hypothetical protein